MDEQILDSGAVDNSAVADPNGAADVKAGLETTSEQAASEPQNDLDAFLADQLKDDGADQTQAVVDPNAVEPDAFAKTLTISEFVKSPEHVEAAVRAADEVWKVTSGQAPATTLLEGMRQANPEGFEKIVTDLIPYIEHLTGEKLGAGDATTLDPVAQLRAEIREQQLASQKQQQDFAYRESVAKAVPILRQTVTETLGKVFGPGNENYFMSQIAANSKLSEQEMVAALNRGDKAPLEAAIKAVKTAELKRFKSMSEHMAKQAKDFRKALPVAKGTDAVAIPDTGKFDLKTAEGRRAYATSVFNGEGQ